ncbi:discoidin domain-containing protein [Candidatus Nitrosocosmicus hydrocola]|uniref:discoidin domain-containing protein n=1 Tax=Candidatus Nitrosocosmicus hydrocola TaxID=1826872 RepID=UPI0011E597BD|nr:discoidin domain-containing protein [Candidatus Nitrosocosmicus hydrocola]
MVQGSKLNEFSTGNVTISIWTVTNPPKSHHDLFQIDVGKTGDDDWVCIGGGARGNSFPGNFVTASFPSDDFKSWNVASRDHINLDASELIGFAIGMKIPSLSKEELRSNLRIKKNQSDLVSHPKISCSVDVDEGFLLLGGGFQVHDQIVGNLGTGSYPDSTISWRAESKDHDIPSPSRITAFAIGIRSNLIKNDGVVIGNVVTSYNSFEEHTGLLVQDKSIKPLSGFALCGGGGTSHYINYPDSGRYLFALEPAFVPTENPIEQFFSARTGRVENFDYANLTVYAMGIKFKPSSSSPPSPPDPPGNDILLCIKRVTATEATASGNVAPFGPQNVKDGNPITKWMSITSNPWIRLSLEVKRTICRVDMLWARETKYSFNISLSTDNLNYNNVFPTPITRTSTSTTDLETYHFAAREAAHVKITITDTGSPANIVEISEIILYSNKE